MADSVKIKITADDSDYRKVMGDLGPIAQKGTQKACEGFTVLKGVVAGLVVGGIRKLSSAITNELGAAISRVDTIKAYEQTMANLGYTSDEVSQATKRLSDGIQALPTSTPAILTTQQKFVALSGNIDEATSLTLALNDATLAGGQGQEIANGALEQWYQIIANGKPDLQSWKIINSAMPAQMNMIAESLLGAGSKSQDLFKAWQDGTVTTQEVIDSLIKLDSEGSGAMASFSDQAISATGGIGTSFANLKTKIAGAIANIIEAIGTDRIVAVVDRIKDKVVVAGEVVADAVEQVVGWISDNWDDVLSVLKTAAITIGSIVTVLGVLKTGLAISGALSAASTAMAVATGVMGFYASGASIATVMTTGFSTAQKVMGTIMAIATGKIKLAEAAQWLWNAAISANPIGIIILAVIAFIAIIVVLWKKCEGFRELVIGIWKKIKAVWDAVLPYFKSLWEGIKAVWDAVAPYLTAAWEVIKSIFLFFIDIIIAYFKFAWTVIKAVWDVVGPYFAVLWEVIKAIFSVVVEVLGGFFSGAWAAIKVIWDVVGPYFKMLWEVIKGVFAVVKAVLSGNFGDAWNAIKGIWDAVTGYFAGVWQGIKDVFADVKNWFSEKFETAWNTIKDWFNIKNATQVFKDSITGGLEAAKEAITKKAGEVWRAIQDAFKKTIKLFFGFGGAEGSGGSGSGGGRISPFASRISSGFGVKRGNRRHGGVDFAAPMGTPIQSTTAGRVIRSTFQAGGFGNYVVVQDFAGNQHYYGHMSRRVAAVGMPVYRGRLLGYVGSTGRSTGPHLHYEVRVGGKAVNPYKWYAGARGYATGGFPGIGELFYANENGIELMGKMGSKNVVANNMQIIEGIKAGIASGAVQAARARANAGNTSKNTEINLNQHFYKEQISPSDTKRAARRGIKAGLAGGLA